MDATEILAKEEADARRKREADAAEDERLRNRGREQIQQQQQAQQTQLQPQQQAQQQGASPDGKTFITEVGPAVAAGAEGGAAEDDESSLASGELWFSSSQDSWRPVTTATDQRPTRRPSPAQADRGFVKVGRSCRD